MNAPITRSSAALLSAGAVAVLLLGAFARPDPAAPAPEPPPADDPADVAIEAAGEPELPTGLSPGLAEVFRLAQSHVDENVILAFIRDSGQTYSPSADEILYLSDLGLSQNVIAALFKQKPSVPPANLASAAAPALTPVTFPKLPSLNSPPERQAASAVLFYDDLAPYGTWLQIPAYGQAWQPAVETLNPDWRPYVDDGQWLSTGNGWYWQSGYSWGAIVFHYGRWAKDNRFGWVWIPDKVWGPAWVSWRIALSYSGWAPLPPGVGLAAANGFTFVSEENFLSPGLPNYAAPPGQNAAIYARSLAVNNYSIARQNALNLGPDKAGLIAAAEPTPEPSVARHTPARSRERVAGPQTAPENSVESFLAAVSREEVVGALPSLDAGPPASQPVKPRRHHWKGNHPAHWNLTDAPRWQPPVNRDGFNRSPSIEPLDRAPQPEPMRLTAASVPASLKSEK
jgi:hypothetical protein